MAPTYVSYVLLVLFFFIQFSESLLVPDVFDDLSHSARRHQIELLCRARASPFVKKVFMQTSISTSKVFSTHTHTRKQKKQSYGEKIANERPSAIPKCLEDIFFYFRKDVCNSVELCASDRSRLL